VTLVVKVPVSAVTAVAIVALPATTFPPT
jgi:hypothetical protein